MYRMAANFHSAGVVMEQHFVHLRSLLKIFDSELYERLQNSVPTNAHVNCNDYTYLYFAYRWFLINFKREFAYEDMFAVWEAIWAAEQVLSPHFYLFIALAIVEAYRSVIIENNMEFTDIIKFFNGCLCTFYFIFKSFL
jgi:hypothetical protein